MATLTLTVGANADDRARISGLDDPHPMYAGGVGGVADGTGMGWRFTGGSALDGATIDSVALSLLKSGTEWKTVHDRWTFEDSDSPAAFTASSPDRPGDRAIVATVIAESHDVNHTDATRYSFPTTSGLRISLAAGLQSAVDRAGFTDTLALIDNSRQDASQNTSFGLKLWHDYDSATASSEPQLVVDYTAAAAGGSRPIFARRVPLAILAR
jgi:hypothetical protein